MAMRGQSLSFCEDGAVEEGGQRRGEVLSEETEFFFFFFFFFFLQKSEVKMRSLFFLSTRRLIAFLSPKVNKKEQIKHTNEK